MLNEYPRNDGFQMEEITFGNGTPLVIEEKKAPPAPEAIVRAQPAFDLVLDRPVLTALPEPAFLAALPEPAPIVAAGASERAAVVETRLQESFKDTEDDVARVAEEIAADLARILDKAIGRLEKRRLSELGSLRTEVAECRQRQDATDGELGDVKQRIGGLLDVVSAQTSTAITNSQKYEELAQGIFALREAATRQESALAAVTGRLDEVAGRVDTHHEELAALRPALLDLSQRVAAVVERLHRQAEAIRVLYETGAHREAALDQLSEVVECLRAFRAPAPLPTAL